MCNSHRWSNGQCTLTIACPQANVHSYSLALKTIAQCRCNDHVSPLTPRTGCQTSSGLWEMQVCRLADKQTIWSSAFETACLSLCLLMSNGAKKKPR